MKTSLKLLALAFLAGFCIQQLHSVQSVKHGST